MKNRLLHLSDIKLYFICTLLFSWLLWIPLAITQVYVKNSPWFYILILGGASPSICGIIFIIKNKLYSKDEFIKSFLSLKQIGIKNLLLLVLIIILPFSLSLILDFLIFKNIPNIKKMQVLFSSPASIILYFITFIYSGPLSEEFGWRGFAAKMLLAKYNVIKTGLIIGIIWSIWHYPLFFLNGQYTIENYFIYIPVRLLKEISLSMIIIYFYQNTNKSVLSAMIIHYFINMSVNLFIPIKYTTNIIHTGLLLIVSLFLVLKMRNDVIESREDSNR